MTFSPCAVIPCFNHGSTVADTVERALELGLPVILVDDGSAADTAMQLRSLTTAHGPRVHLIRREINGGKGAAVMAGLRAAHQAGYTHALQIDADGQHDTADIPRFLAHGRLEPTALVCGEPEFDASAPRARRFGRYLTHVWVWIETLSFQIRDSLCGFRLYPLSSTVALLDREPLPPRMDFDIEVLVRLCWDGVPIRGVPTKVRYPAGGLSHFRPLRDNLRISWMHTRLVVGMLARLPRLLARRLRDHAAESNPNTPLRESRPSAARWADLTERGSAWGIRLVAASQRRAGPRIARLVLLPAVAWFFLTGRVARTASRDYLRRVRAVAGAGAAPSASARNMLRHMLCFAEAGLDKLAAWSGQIGRDEVDFARSDEFERLVAAGQGALLIGSHLGNLEMTRALGVREAKIRINAIVHTAHARRFAAALASTDDRFAIHAIEVDELGPETAIALRAKVEAGEFVVIVGDRTPPADNGRVAWVPFFGQPAPFPHGPYVLAHLLECPVYLFFCLREGERYRVYLESFADRIRLPRGAREAALTEWARRYAERLQHYCLRAPLQWFNFYDFWHRDHPHHADS